VSLTRTSEINGKQPSAIAELFGTLGRANDVGEQHGREHTVADDRSPHTGQEMLNVVGDGVLLAEPNGIS
jgi:hypothetical protein